MENSIDLAIKFVASLEGSPACETGFPVSFTGDFSILFVLLLLIVFISASFVLLRTYRQTSVNFKNSNIVSANTRLSSFESCFSSSIKIKILAIVCAVAFILSLISCAFCGIQKANAIDEAKFMGSDIIGYVDEATGNISFRDGDITNIGGADAIVTQVITKRPAGIDDGGASWTIDSGDISLFSGTTSLEGRTATLSNELLISANGGSIPLTVSVDGLSAEKAKSLIDKNVVSLSFKLKDKEPDVHVTGVELDQSSMSLMAGDSAKLTETVKPDNAADKSVTWSSSNESVASVDQSGNVKAISAGSATIIVTTNDGGFSATCIVDVLEPVVIIEVPLPTKIGDLTYNGHEQTGINLDESYLSYFNIDGDVSATDADNYNATFSLKDKTSSIWSDNTTEDKSLDWSIKKATPYISNLDCSDVFYGEVPQPSACTDFGKIQYFYSNSESGKYGEWDISNSPGTYFVKASVSASDNWNASESLPISFCVKEREIQVSPEPAENLEYTGCQQNLGKVITQPSDCDVGYFVCGVSQKDEPQATNAGLYTIGYVVSKMGYATVSGEFYTTIDTAKVEVPNPIENLIYNGDVQMGFEVDLGAPYTLCNFSGTDAKDYVATATLNDKNNYAWQSTTPTSWDQNISWSIKKASLKITGLDCSDIYYEERPDPSASSDFGDIIYLYSNSETGIYGNWDASNLPGIYFVKASVTSTDNWNYAESSPKAFEVIAKSIAATPHYDASGLVYIGTDQSLGYVETDPSDCNVQYSVNDTPIEGVPQATNAGEYKVSYTVSKTGYTTVRDDFYVTIAKDKVEVPVAIVGLTYNGQNQTGVVMVFGAKYGLEGYKARDAGNYDASAILKDKINYEWQLKSPTSDDQTVHWSIAKATPNITGVACSDISYGEIPDPSASADFGTITFSYSSSKDGEYGPWDISNPSGTYWVKAYVQDTDNWTGEESSPIPFTVNKRMIDVIPHPAEALVFDGTDQSLGFVETSPLDCSVEYSVDEESVLAGLPHAKDAGNYSVGYKVSKSGYKEVSGSFSVTIEKADATLTLDPSSAEYTVPADSSFKYDYKGDGEISVSSSNTAVASVALDQCTVMVTPLTTGNTTITVSCSEGNNYKEVSATHLATVNAGTINVTSNPAENLSYTGYAQKLGDASADIEDCAIEYSVDDGAYSPAEPYATDAGTHKVGYRVSKPGYEEVIGDFTVTIAKAKVVEPDIYVGLLYNGEEQTGVAATDNKYSLSGNIATDASTYEATASLYDQSNYAWDPDIPSSEDKKITWSISKATPIISGLSCSNITVGDSPDPSASTNFGEIKYTYSKSQSGPYGDWDTTNPAGTYWVKASVEDSNNWNGVESSPISFTVNEGSIVVTPHPAEDLIYDGTDQSLGYVETNPLGCTIEYSVNDQSVIGIPKANDAGNYSVGYKVSKNGYTDVVIGSFSVSIAKADATFTLDPSFATYTVPADGSFKYNYKGDGEISVSSSDTAVASVALDQSTVTVTPLTTGNTTITVSCSEGNNYKEVSANHIATVNAGTINVTSNPAKNLSYTGNAQKLGNVIVDVEDCAIEYSVDDGAYSPAEPYATDAGNHIVRYKVSKSGYNDASGEFPVSISKAKVVEPDIYVGLLYNGEEQTGVVATDNKYSLSDNTATDAGIYEATASLYDQSNYAWESDMPSSEDKKIPWSISQATPIISGLSCSDVPFGETPDPRASTNFGTITYSYSKTKDGEYGSWDNENEPSTYWVKASVEGTNNWRDAASSPVSFTVNEKFITVEQHPAQNLIYTETDQSLGIITTDPTDCSIEYFVNDQSVQGDPKANNAGNYSVGYKVTKQGYSGVIGSFSVTIAKASPTITDLSCSDISFGDAPAPSANTDFGELSYLYSVSETGPYVGWNTSNLPDIYWVKAFVAEDDNWLSAESDPMPFSVIAKDIDTKSHPAKDLSYTGEEMSLGYVDTEPSGCTIQYSVNDVIMSGDPLAKDVGTYTVKYYVSKPGYNSAEGQFEGHISKAKVTVPNAKENLVYNGNEQTGIDQILAAKYTLTGHKATNAGDYTANASLNDNKNYEWDVTNPTSEDISIPWSISKAINNMSFEVTTNTYTSTHSDDKVKIDFPGAAINPPENLEYGAEAISLDNPAVVNDESFAVEYDSSLNKWYLVCGAGTDVGTYQLKIWAKSGGVNYEEKYVPEKDSVALNFIWIVINEVIHAESVEIDQSWLDMEIGDNAKLSETVKPDNTTDKSVTWSSSNDEVASVDQSGNVEAKSAGNAIITVDTNDGHIKDTCSVNVCEHTVPVTGVELDTSSLRIICDTSSKLTATVLPEQATDKSVTWSSSNEDIATVDEHGVISTHYIGDVVITVETNDGHYRASCNVSVIDYVLTQVTNIPYTNSVGTKQNVNFVPVFSDDNKTYLRDVEIKYFLDPSGIYEDASINNLIYRDEGCTMNQLYNELKDQSGNVKTLYACCEYASDYISFYAVVDEIWGQVFATPSVWSTVYPSRLNPYGKLYSDLLTNDIATVYFNGKDGEELQTAWHWHEPADERSGPCPQLNGINYSNYHVGTSTFYEAYGGNGGGILSQKSAEPWSSRCTSYEHFPFMWYSSRSFWHEILPNEVKGTVLSLTFPDVAPTDVKLDQNSITLEENETAKLTATVRPTNTTSKTVNWETSDYDVVEVDNQGNIIANGVGEATVTASTLGYPPWYKDSCKVIVRGPTVNVDSVTLDQSYTDLNIDSSVKLTETVHPDNATDKSVIWYSSDDSIASVDENGYVTPKKSGKVIITVETNDGHHKASCEIDVVDYLLQVTNIPYLNSNDIKQNVNFVPAFSNDNTTYLKDNGVKYYLDPSQVCEDATINNLIYRDEGCTMNQLYNCLKDKTGQVKTLYARANPNVEFYAVVDETWNDVFGTSAESQYPSCLNKDGTLYNSLLSDTIGTIYFNGKDGKELQPDQHWSATREEISDNVCPVLNNVNYSASSDDNASTFYTSYGCADGGVLGSKAHKALSSHAMDSLNSYLWSTNSNLWSKGLRAGNSGVILTLTFGSIPVNGVTLDKSLVDIECGKSFKLNETVLPSCATDKSVRWVSSNEDVACVDENGNVTVKKSGNATITVETNSGHYTANCKVRAIDYYLTQVTNIAYTNSLNVDQSVNFVPAFSDASTTYLKDNCVKYYKDSLGIEEDSSINNLIYRSEGCTMNQLCGELKDSSGNVKTLYVRANSGVKFFGIVAESWDEVFGPSVYLGYPSRLNMDGKLYKTLLSDTIGTVYFNGKNGEELRGEWHWNEPHDAYSSYICPQLNGVDYSHRNKDKSCFYEAYNGRDGGILNSEANAPWSTNVTNTCAHSWFLEYAFWTEMNRTYTKGTVLELTFPDIHVNGVSLDKTTLDLKTGETTKLTETVNPFDACDKSVTWTSSNDNIASVDASGYVTAKTSGNVCITVTTNDGGYVAKCDIGVRDSSIKQVTNISYTNSKGNIQNVNFVPAFPDSYTSYLKKHRVKYYSDSSGLIEDSSINDLIYGYDGCTMSQLYSKLKDDSGNIKTLYAKADYGTNFYAVINETWNDVFGSQVPYGYPSSLNKDGNLYNNLLSGSIGTVYFNGKYGKDLQIDQHWSATDDELSQNICPVLNGVAYSGDTNDQVLSFYESYGKNSGGILSSNSVIPFSSRAYDMTNSFLWGIEKKDWMQATRDGDYGIVLSMTFDFVPVEEVTLDHYQLDLQIGDSNKLNETVLPANASDKTVTWTSSNTEVASVDNLGNITTKNLGSTKITVTTNYGGYNATCTVNVIDKRTIRQVTKIDYVNTSGEQQNVNFVPSFPDSNPTFLQDNGVKYYLDPLCQYEETTINNLIYRQEGCTMNQLYNVILDSSGNVKTLYVKAFPGLKFFAVVNETWNDVFGDTSVIAEGNPAHLNKSGKLYNHLLSDSIATVYFDGKDGEILQTDQHWSATDDELSKNICPVLNGVNYSNNEQGVSTFYEAYGKEDGGILSSGSAFVYASRTKNVECYSWCIEQWWYDQFERTIPPLGTVLTLTF